MKMDCCVVRDLLPLYLENMVSDQTAVYIKQHMDGCTECRDAYESFKESGKLEALETSIQKPKAEGTPFKKTMQRFNRQMHALAYGLIVFFILWGFSLTGGQDLMYNSVIMPVVGVFGYYVFRWKAVYKMPVLLLVIDLLAYSLNFARIEFISVFQWTLIYSIFVVIGVLIAFLLHFAFRKEHER